MRGRKAAGPEFVYRLQGELGTKRRGERILQTLTGELRFQEAAGLLEITPQQLHALRAQALQGFLDALAPKPVGRPPQLVSVTAAELAALRAENERLRRELAACQLREELALLLPGRQERGEKKRRTGAARPGRAGR